MAQPFKDFIPEGGELDGLGKGFSDFVPTPVVPVANTEPQEAPLPQEPKQTEPTPVTEDNKKSKK